MTERAAELPRPIKHPVDITNPPEWRQYRSRLRSFAKTHGLPFPLEAEQAVHKLAATEGRSISDILGLRPFPTDNAQKAS